MTGYKAILTKSTVPVGTSSKVKEVVQATLLKRQLDIPFDIISNPEFLKEGTAVEDCLKPMRIVVGCESEKAKQLMKQLYDPFLRNGHPILFMDLLSSEMTKYAANSMLATKISFMNELSRVCEKVGADIEKVRHGIGSDSRIGYDFIYPGLGYGGSCFPKDVKALVKTGDSLGESLLILKAVEETNRLQRVEFVRKMKKHFGNQLAGKRFAVWGLAFKPGTDDVRDAPSETVIQSLLDAGSEISVFDPVAARSFKKSFPQISSQIQFVESQYAVLDGADALCIFTEWKQFREPNFDKIKLSLKDPVIFDGRNLYDIQYLGSQGFKYYSVGRSASEVDSGHSTY
jgi:UDPglucose 6-dehydrogenase